MSQIEDWMLSSDQEYAYLQDGTRWWVHTYGIWHNPDIPTRWIPRCREAGGGTWARW